MANSEYSIKRCPYCSANLKGTDTKCHSCNRKVGPGNEQGIAEKPFDWKGYTMSVAAFIAFIYFMWFAFFRNTE